MTMTRAATTFPCDAPFGGTDRMAHAPVSAHCPHTVGDEQLMLQYQGGDPVAFQALYQRFRDPLFRFIVRMATSKAEAEEIFQEVWLAVVRGKERYRPCARFVTYLFAIAHRRTLDRLRAHGRVDEQPLPDDDEYAIVDDVRVPPDLIAHTAQNAQALAAAIAALPMQQRNALLMQIEGGLSVEEIAQATQANRETVKSRLRYAMRHLRAALENRL
jgi:RNA polymerase sigma-70 factor (ECF subfamily)